MDSFKMEDAVADEQQGDYAGLNGSGSNRQAKRLQLRKAGFRAKAVAQRNVTPKHQANDARSRIISGSVNSPRGVSYNFDVGADTPERCSSSGVLKEISNSSRRTKKQSRPRIDDNFSIFHDENPLPSPKAALLDRESLYPSCATPDSAGRSRRVSSRLQRSALHRRQSDSIDTAKYIEHLEAELAATQTQLSSMTSPTVMQARSHKMRALNAESRALQDEVAQWEAKFHDRVQEEIDERNKLEASLKARIRMLETDAEEYAQKVRDLQIQLETSNAAITATETVNDELEKRIDAITDLVGSPQKREIERFAFSPRKRHVRHKSTLPRFPTTGSLSFPFGKPAEAMAPATPNPHSQSLQGAPRVDSGLEIQPGQDAVSVNFDLTLEQSAALSDGPSSASSSKRFSWSTPGSEVQVPFHAESAVPASTGKPSRRMRRFHATNMPKPLLLPCTASGLHNVPATAPALENHETPPSFPFPALPEVIEQTHMQPFEFLISPIADGPRRRALTSADGMNIALRRISSSFLITTPSASSNSDEALLPSPAISASAEETPRDFSSLGSAVGRNLFEELQRVKNTVSDAAESEATRNVSGTSVETERPAGNFSSRSTSWSAVDMGCHGVRRRAWTSHGRCVSDHTGIARAQDSANGSANQREDGEDGAFSLSRSPQDSRFLSRAYFADLYRASFLTARQTLLYAQSVTLRSASVQRLQLFLVELFLGPQVGRRMMAASMRRSSLQSRDALREVSGTPTRSGRRASKSGALQGFGEDAVVRARKRSRGDGEQRRVAVWWNRHSPWLWIRFSITLAFAIGAAIRDGPGAVMGVES